MDTSKLQERIANVYYRHGLFCARHPVAVICICLLVISFACYPLIYLPIFKSAFYFKTPPFQAPSSSQHWFQEGPVAYILQVVLKSSVLPWQEDLKLQDAFRGPLAQVFSLEEAILNHQLQAQNGSVINLSQLCLQVSEPLRFSALLPHYSCLVVSPSHLWNNDISTFHQDEDIVRTIFNSPDPKLDSSNIKEILFGVPWKETGIKRFNVRTRSRVLTYAVTIVMKDFNIDFLRSLRHELIRKYPHGTQLSPVYNEEDLSFLHFNNQGQDSAHLVQYLALTYLVAFIYIYFSVCKMDLVEWKVLMALSAVATLILTLLMAVGLCLWFGLLPSTWKPIGLRCDLNDILPYVIIVVGLENHFIITKSVISTPTHIDLKLRVAQGLSKEGYSITKHFAMEVVLLLMAFCTCMPTIQEFCQVAFVGIISDFFLQLVFFTTLLSTNLKKIESLDSYKPYHLHKTVPSLAADGSKQDLPQLYTTPVLSLSRAMMSKMAFRRNGWSHFSRSSTPILVTVPKRLRFVYFWARTRMVQRFLMLCLIGWIVWLLYISGFVEHLHLNMGLISTLLSALQPLLKLRTYQDRGELDLNGTLVHGDPELWRQLPPQHWSTLLGLYNISLLGRSVSILPPLLLSAPVSPSMAVGHSTLPLPTDLEEEDVPGEELYLTLAVSVPTVCLVVYIMIVLYRCMCTRHYAEWRTSWTHRSSNVSSNLAFPNLDNYAVMEAPPISLPDHSHELEDLVSHGNLVVGTCLTGDVLVWDSRSGECINLILRNQGGTEEDKGTPTTPVITSTYPTSEEPGYDFGRFYSTSPDSLLTQESLISHSGITEPVEESRVHRSSLPFQPVWSLDCHDWLCVLGCAKGRIEVWDGYTGTLLCYHSDNPVGITAIRLTGRRIMLTRVDGSLEFFHLKEYLVTAGAGDHQESYSLLRLHNLKPHNQPISCLLVHQGNVVITGSQDHLIKVFKYDTVTCLFTLHGHIGSITTLHIDDEQGTLVSGCGGGRLCMWDLGTGTCVYSLQGHSGPVTGLHTTSMYLVSSSPTLICIWEKSQGHLLHSIRKERNLCNDFVLLTPNVMVTARENQLLVWDVNHGEALRMILLSQADQTISRLCQWGQTLVVAFSSRLFLIHFPSGSSAEKTD